MISKKVIQNIALAMTIATAGSVALPNLVSAKSVDNPKQINLQTMQRNVRNTVVYFVGVASANWVVYSA